MCNQTSTNAMWGSQAAAVCPLQVPVPTSQRRCHKQTPTPVETWETKQTAKEHAAAALARRKRKTNIQHGIYI